MSRTRWLALVGLTGAALLSAAAPATAAPRFASPTGSGASCTSGSPCAITTAINSAMDGDEVIVTPGSYGTPASRIATNISSGADIVVHGVAGEPRPRIYSDATFPFHLGNPNAVLRHLEIDADSGNNVGALRFQGALAEDFVARGNNQRGCELAGSPTLRNGVCQQAGGPLQWEAVVIPAALAPIPHVTLRNMTILANLGKGLFITSVSSRPIEVTMINSIARGGASTVDIHVDSNDNANATLITNHDNFLTTSTTVEPATTGLATIQQDGPSQSADPLLIAPVHSQFQQLPNSPTVNAGLDDAANGPLDFDQQPRTMRGRTDIGADELPDSCRGRRATVFGGPTRDVLTGTSGPDVFFGAGGRDVFRGLRGRDVASGGPGGDKLIGGAGRDLLVGGSGRDRLIGGGGRDRLIGGGGRDRLIGGAGRDRLAGGPGLDFQVQ